MYNIHGKTAQPYIGIPISFVIVFPLEGKEGKEWVLTGTFHFIWFLNLKEKRSKRKYTFNLHDGGPTGTLHSTIVDMFKMCHNSNETF